MKTERFLPAQIWTIAQADEGNAVFIRAEEHDLVLPIYVSEADIQIILVELTHILAPRPMVHELLLSAIDSLQGKLDRVEIYGMKSGTYLCRIVISANGKEIRLESRPSDSLCLAACIECPVHIDDEVLARNGIPIERIKGHRELSGIGETLSTTDFLQKELQDAVEREEFERAATLRDQLVEIRKGRKDQRFV